MISTLMIGEVSISVEELKDGSLRLEVLHSNKTKRQLPIQFVISDDYNYGEEFILNETKLRAILRKEPEAEVTEDLWERSKKYD